MKQIGRAVVLVAALAVTTIAPRHATAQKLLGDGVKELSDQIVSSASEQQKRRIAVLAFRELNGEQTVLGAYLAESLTTQLFRARGFEILERTMLDKIVGEMKLASTGLIDPSTAARIGKLAGVDAIVTGSVTDMQSSVAVNCRVIDVATGRVFGVADSRIVKDDDLRAIMGKGLAPVVSAPKPGIPSAPAAAPALETESYRVSVASLRRQGDAVILELLFENPGDTLLRLSWRGDFDERTYLLSDQGQKCSLDGPVTAVGGRGRDSQGIVWRSGYGPVELAAGTKVRSRFVFSCGRAGAASQSFDLVSTEGAPKDGRSIVLRGLR